MAPSRQPEIIHVVHNQVLDDDEFASGLHNGYLHYYDTNFQLPRPLTCQSVYALMKENLADPRESERRNAGFVFGWIAALSENHQDHFFTSIVQTETELVHHAALQQV